MSISFPAWDKRSIAPQRVPLTETSRLVLGYGKTWYAFPFTFDSCDGGVATEFADLARPAKWEGLERKVGQG